MKQYIVDAFTDELFKGNPAEVCGERVKISGRAVLFGVSEILAGRKQEDNLDYTIVEHIADLSAPNNGMTKELNFISRNNREPVYDIRTWNADHSEYGKGVTLTYREMKTLKQALRNINLF